MTTYPNMGLTLPTRGAPGSGLWGDTDDANSALIDAHDHSSGKGAPVRTAGISIDADLSFSSLYAAKDLQRITFASVAALSSNNKSLFVNTSDNELYWRSNGGANVKLTSGSSLNVGAFTGGIGGDYSAVSASVQYDDANKRYTFKQGGGTTWAKLHAGGLRLAELGTSETVFVEQIAPAALAASYTMTWPLAVPASTSLMLMDNAGTVSVSNTVPNALTLSGGATVGANQNVTLSGTGTYKQGTKSINIPLRAADVIMTAGTFSVTMTAYGFAFAPSDAGYIMLPELPAHWRIVNVTMGFTIAGDRTNTTLSLAQSGTGDAATTTISDISSTTFTNTGTAKKQIAGVNLSPSSGQVYFVKFAIAAGGVSGKLANLVIDYDVP